MVRKRLGSSKFKRILCYFAATAVIYALLLAISFPFGRGSLGYFSPDTFATKYQAEICLPLLAIPIYRSGCTQGPPYEFVDYLVENGYWSPMQTNNPRWLQMYHWNIQWHDGYSTIYRELTGRFDWKNWSESNPEIASVLWPTTLAILRAPGDEIEAAPLLLWFAKQSTTVAELNNIVMNDPELQSFGVSAIWERSLDDAPG